MVSLSCSQWVVFAGGEDIAWKWFVGFATFSSDRNLSLVLDRRTNKHHSEWLLFYIFVDLGNKFASFFGIDFSHRLGMVSRGVVTPAVAWGDGISFCPSQFVDA